MFSLLSSKQLAKAFHADLQAPLKRLLLALFSFLYNKIIPKHTRNKTRLSSHCQLPVFSLMQLEKTSFSPINDPLRLINNQSTRSPKSGDSRTKRVTLVYQTLFLVRLRCASRKKGLAHETKLNCY